MKNVDTLNRTKTAGAYLGRKNSLSWVFLSAFQQKTFCVIYLNENFNVPSFLFGILFFPQRRSSGIKLALKNREF